MKITFFATLVEKNEVELVIFKKSKGYAVTELSIHQDTDSTEVLITETGRLETLSNLIQKLVKGKKEPNLYLKITNAETLDITIPFQKNTHTMYLY